MIKITFNLKHTNGLTLSYIQKISEFQVDHTIFLVRNSRRNLN